MKNVFQMFNTRTKKYLHEMPELFGGWSKQKGPKKAYSRPGAARGALSNLAHTLRWVHGSKNATEFDPAEWEVHELELTVVKREPYQK